MYESILSYFLKYINQIRKAQNPPIIKSNNMPRHPSFVDSRSKGKDIPAGKCNLRSSSIVKTKAYKNAFYHMYVCPTSAHRGFRYGYRRYKGNTFTLKTTLFGCQSMALRSDLTLLNINMPKNSIFA